MHRMAIVMVALMALVVAACGGDEDENADIDGAAIFASGTQPSCSSCHTLSAAGSTGTVGPVLDGSAAPAAFIETVVREGSGAMPSFDGQLSDAEIAAVARYVDDNA
jgi:sulfite dehydrogenase